MLKKYDLTGNIFGRLRVMEFSHTQSEQLYWKCLCECGKEKIVRGGRLRSGEVISCGCHNGRHGMSKHWFYSTYKSQLGRCENSKHRDYYHYGGRGIKCLWSAEEACKWADENPRPSKEHECDRIDNNGHYCADNVRWVTRTENNLNKRNNVSIDKYEKVPCQRQYFKKYCTRHGEDFYNFDEFYSGIDDKNGSKKYFYIRRNNVSTEMV